MFIEGQADHFNNNLESIEDPTPIFKPDKKRNVKRRNTANSSGGSMSKLMKSKFMDRSDQVMSEEEAMELNNQSIAINQL